MRFTLRELMLFTAVVLLSAGWSVDRARLTKRNTELQFQVQASKSLVENKGWTMAIDRRGVVFDRPDVAVSELERQVQAAIVKSAELGAPQPQPLPPGFGDPPNQP